MGKKARSERQTDKAKKIFKWGALAYVTNQSVNAISLTISPSRANTWGGEKIAKRLSV